MNARCGHAAASPILRLQDYHLKPGLPELTGGQKTAYARADDNAGFVGHPRYSFWFARSGRYGITVFDEFPRSRDARCTPQTPDSLTREPNRITPSGVVFFLHGCVKPPLARKEYPMNVRLALCVVCLAGFLAGRVHAAGEKEEPQELKLGQDAPDFNVPKGVLAQEERPGEKAETEEPVKLSDFEGKKNVLLAFYPKAFTPGCTKQLCGYRDDAETFKSSDTLVMAISLDEQADSGRFRKDYELPFPVIGDAKGEIVKAYRVPVAERGAAHYASRSVYLVDKQGKLRYIDREYRVEEDKQALYDALNALDEENSPAPIDND